MRARQSGALPAQRSARGATPCVSKNHSGTGTERVAIKCRNTSGSRVLRVGRAWPMAGPSCTPPSLPVAQQPEGEGLSSSSSLHPSEKKEEEEEEEEEEGVCASWISWLLGPPWSTAELRCAVRQSKLSFHPIPTTWHKVLANLQGLYVHAANFEMLA